MEIKKITEDKERFMDLLLLGDEQESMILKYLGRGELFALYDTDLKTVCVVTQEDENTCEIKNIATYVRQEGKLDIQKQIESHEDEILKIKARINNLEDKYLDGEIDRDTYYNAKERYNKDISKLEEKIDILENPNRANIEPKLTYSIDLKNNMDYHIIHDRVEVKCKLISSVFHEKIVFDGKTYRTNSYNKVLDLIYQQTNELRGTKIKNGESFSTFSASVPRADVGYNYSL